MSVTFPEGVEGEGTIKIVAVPAVADLDAPTVAELTAGTAVDLSCYVTSDGFQPTSEQESRTDRRLCSTQVLAVPGSITYTVGDLVYIYDPQAAAADPENEAYEYLAPGASRYIVVRWGLAYDTAFASGQKVDVYPVTMGAQRKNAPVTGAGGGEGTSKLTVTQSSFLRAPAEIDAIVA